MSLLQIRIPAMVEPIFELGSGSIQCTPKNLVKRFLKFDDIQQNPQLCGHAANSSTPSGFGNARCSFQEHSLQLPLKKRKLIDDPVRHLSGKIEMVPPAYPQPKNSSVGLSADYECLSERKSCSVAGGSTTTDLLLEFNLMNTAGGGGHQSSHNPDHNGTADSNSALTSEHLHLVDHDSSLGSRCGKSDNEISDTSLTPDDSAAADPSTMLLSTIPPEHAKGSLDLDPCFMANELPKLVEEPRPELTMHIPNSGSSREVSSRMRLGDVTPRNGLQLGMDRFEGQPGWKARTRVRTASISHDSDGDWLQLGIPSTPLKPSKLAETHKGAKGRILEQPKVQGVTPTAGPRRTARWNLQQAQSVNSWSPECLERTGLQGAGPTDFDQALQQITGRVAFQVTKRPASAGGLQDMNDLWLTMDGGSRARDSMQLPGYVHPSTEHATQTQHQAHGSFREACERLFITSAVEADQQESAASRLHCSPELVPNRTGESDTKSLQPTSFQQLIDCRSGVRSPAMVLTSSFDIQNRTAPRGLHHDQSDSRGRRGSEGSEDHSRVGPAIDLKRIADSQLEDVHFNVALAGRAFPPCEPAAAPARITQAPESFREQPGGNMQEHLASCVLQQQQQQLQAAGPQDSTSGSTCKGMTTDDAGYTRFNFFDCSRRIIPAAAELNISCRRMMQPLSEQDERCHGTDHVSLSRMVRLMRNPLSAAASEEEEETSSCPGIWFKFHAAENQSTLAGPPLQQVTKYYLRVKDENMPVSMLKKYLVQKLGLAEESEVDISCNGQLLDPCLLLHYVQAFIWLQAGPRNHSTAPAPPPPIITQVPAATADSASVVDQIRQIIQAQQQTRSSLQPTAPASTQLPKSPEELIMVFDYSRAAAPQFRPC